APGICIDVASRAALHDVVPRAAGTRVVAVPACERIVPCERIDPVIAAGAFDVVVALGTKQVLIVVGAGELYALPDVDGTRFDFRLRPDRAVVEFQPLDPREPRLRGPLADDKRLSGAFEPN